LGWSEKIPAQLAVFAPRESILLHKDELAPACFLFGGLASEHALASSLGFRPLHVSSEYLRKNSFFTAEAVAAIAIHTLPYSLSEATMLLLGYGNLGKACAAVFRSLGSRVLVCSFDVEEQLLAKAAGYTVVSLSDFGITEHFFLLNTIPAAVLDSVPLTIFPPTAVLFELASVPCLSKFIPQWNVIACPALPAKYCPESAAQLMFQEITSQIKKE